MSTFTVLIILLLIIIVLKVLEQRVKKKPRFDFDKINYKKKSPLTPTEQKFYKILQETVGDSYSIQVQMHLSTLLQHTTHSELNSIIKKSVDFVLCDKNTIAPVLVIELDDYRHNWPSKVRRDTFVNTILERASIPILRVKVQSVYSNENLKSLIDSKLVIKS